MNPESNTTESAVTATAAEQPTKKTPKASVEYTQTNPLDYGRLQFTFANGHVSTIDIGSLPAEMRIRLTGHGLEQKLRDSYAGSKTADEAEGLYGKVLDNIQAGRFVSPRAESAGEESVELLIKAMEMAYAAKNPPVEPPANLREVVTNATKEQRAAYRAYEPIAVQLAKLRAKTSTAVAMPEGL